MTKPLPPWSLSKWERVMFRAGYDMVARLGEDGRAVGHIWRHANGYQFHPCQLDANGQEAWREYAARHETPPPF